MKTANFLILFMLAAVCIGMTACTKGDAPKKNNNSLLVGTWKLDGSYATTVTFNADGTGYYSRLIKPGNEFEHTQDEFSKDEMTYILDDSMLLTITYDKRLSNGIKMEGTQINFIDSDHFGRGDPKSMHYMTYTRQKPA